MELKMENPTHSFRETNLSSFENGKLKVSCGGLDLAKEKTTFSVPLILSEGIFLTFIIYLIV